MSPFLGPVDSPSLCMCCSRIRGTGRETRVVPSTSPSQGTFCLPLKEGLRESLPLWKILESLSEMEAKSMNDKDLRREDIKDKARLS